MKAMTIEERRLKALAELKKCKELELREKEKKFYDAGKLMFRYAQEEINAKTFKDEFKKITGLIYKDPTTENSFFEESEIMETLK